MTSTARRRVLAAAALTATVALAACAEPSPAWRSAPPPTSTPGRTASAAGPSATPRAEALTFAFAGDVNFIDRTRRLLDAGPDKAFGPYAETLAAADFAMVNLETAVTTRGTEQPKQFHFRAPVTAYDAIKAAGIDLVSVANNHTLDYGQVGLLDTLDSARVASMPVVGAGRNAGEAYAPYFATVRGVRIGVVAMSQVHELAEQWKPTATRPGIAMAFDAAKARAAVRAARAKADIVIVFMHWGMEGSSCPKSEQKTFARLAADAGADIVVGTHAHVLLADGWMGGTYVHYGLGNFLWYGASRSTDTGVLRLTVRPGAAGGGFRAVVIEKEFLPGVVTGTGQPKPVTGAARAEVERRLADAAKCTGLAPAAP